VGVEDGWFGVEAFLASLCCCCHCVSRHIARSLVLRLRLRLRLLPLVHLIRMRQ